jgi:hypothetical protein
MSMQVLPTAPSPTVTHLMNLEAVVAIVGTNTKNNNNDRKKRNFSLSQSIIVKRKTD